MLAPGSGTAGRLNARYAQARLGVLLEIKNRVARRLCLPDRSLWPGSFVA